MIIMQPSSNHCGRFFSEHCTLRKVLITFLATSSLRHWANRADGFTTHHRWNRWNFPISPVKEISLVRFTVQSQVGIYLVLTKLSWINLLIPINRRRQRQRQRPASRHFLFPWVWLDEVIGRCYSASLPAGKQRWEKERNGGSEEGLKVNKSLLHLDTEDKGRGSSKHISSQMFCPYLSLGDWACPQVLCTKAASRVFLVHPKLFLSM